MSTGIIVGVVVTVVMIAAVAAGVWWYNRNHGLAPEDHADPVSVPVDDSSYDSVTGFHFGEAFSWNNGRRKHE